MWGGLANEGVGGAREETAGSVAPLMQSGMISASIVFEFEFELALALALTAESVNNMECAGAFESGLFVAWRWVWRGWKSVGCDGGGELVEVVWREAVGGIVDEGGSVVGINGRFNVGAGAAKVSWHSVTAQVVKECWLEVMVKAKV